MAMKKRKIRLALAQMANAGSIKNNLSKSIQLLKAAAENKADLVLFPEVQLTEFFPQYPGKDVSKYAIPLDSDIIKQFCAACKAYCIMAVPNIYLLENGKTYDASILIDQNGSILGVQKMVHIAQAEQFFEQDYYMPSDDGFHVFDTAFGKIGIVVCFDRHYPESIRTEALMGADLILIPTVNTKEEPSKMFAWEIRVQAFQNSVLLAMCNRVGTEDRMKFSGESIVTDANGEVLVMADDTEQLLYADVDLQQAETVRKYRPYTQLRRNEWYL